MLGLLRATLERSEPKTSVRLRVDREGAATMNFAKSAIVLAFCGIASAMTGCATADDSQAPEVATDAISPEDEGSSYNGWSISLTCIITEDDADGNMNWTFIRSSGDSTRGGGTCMLRAMGWSCS